MTVSTISSNVLEQISSQYAAKETKTSENSQTKDDFLKIFLAQLQNQDPLNPMEGTDMTSQLSQFTMVEQLYNVNEKLDTLTQKLEGSSSAGPLEYMGKDILLEGNELQVKNKETLGGISFSLEETAQVGITVCDSEGNEVKYIHYGPAQAGSYQVKWDGMDNDGNQAADGTYTYKVAAIGNNGEEVSVQTNCRLRVTGVEFDSGKPYLLAGDLRVDPDSVISVHDPSE